jgi:hypothetical protein
MDFIEDSLRRLRQDHPDLAVLIMAILNELSEIKGQLDHKPAPKRLDLSKLAQPQALLYIGGGIALLMQAPLPVVIDWIKAIAPLLSP